MADIVPRQATENVVGFLSKHKGAIERCIPKHLTGERLLSVVNNALRKTPRLMECTPVSVLNSILHISQLGLEVRPGSAYLVPFGKECTPIIDYRGKIDLARRSREVKDIAAEIVYAMDTWEFERSNEFPTGFRLLHRPALSATEGGRLVAIDDAGDAVLGYSIAVLRDGGVHVEVMRVAAIEKLREKSMAKLYDSQKKSSPWVTDWEEMARKTCIHRICKYLPQTPELARSQMLDESESGEKVAPMFENLETGVTLDIDDPAAYEEPILKIGREEQAKIADAKVIELGGTPSPILERERKARVKEYSERPDDAGAFPENTVIKVKGELWTNGIERTGWGRTQ